MTPIQKRERTDSPREKAKWERCGRVGDVSGRETSAVVGLLALWVGEMEKGGKCGVSDM